MVNITEFLKQNDMKTTYNEIDLKIAELPCTLINSNEMLSGASSEINGNFNGNGSCGN